MNWDYIPIILAFCKCNSLPLWPQWAFISIHQRALRIDCHLQWSHVAFRAIGTTLSSERNVQALKVFITTSSLSSRTQKYLFHSKSRPKCTNLLSAIRHLVGKVAKRFCARLPNDLHSSSSCCSRELSFKLLQSEKGKIGHNKTP